MTHPITPPPELVQQWANESPMECSAESWAYELFIAHHAAQWGADQELEACCEWFVRNWTDIETVDNLRAARRPKPLSLKEQALDVLHLSFDRGYLKEEAVDAIRRALEQLDD
jgi:hypothetical protein